MIQNPEATRENINKFNYIGMDVAQCTTDKSTGKHRAGKTFAALSQREGWALANI